MRPLDRRHLQALIVQEPRDLSLEQMAFELELHAERLEEIARLLERKAG